MQFLSIRDIFEAYKQTQLTVNKKNVAAVIGEIEVLSATNPKGSLALSYTSVSYQEAILFLTSVTEEQFIFQDWIETNAPLKKALTKQEFSEVLREDKRISEHFLIEPFKKYVSDYLAPVMNNALTSAFEEDEDFKVLNQIDSFKILLKTSSLELHEQKVDTFLRSFAAKKKAILPKVKSVDELNKTFNFFRNEHLISLLNRFSKVYYSTVLEFVALATSLFQHKMFTKQFAKATLQSIKQLELNPEHAAQITSLSKGLSTGKVKTLGKNTVGTGKRKFRVGSSVIVLLSFLLIVITLIVLFSSDVFNAKKPGITTHKSGFDSLDIEELKILDTLLGLNSDTTTIELEDYSIPTTSTTVITTYTANIDNEVIQKLHQDLLEDYNIQTASGYGFSMYNDCNALTAASYKGFNYKGIDAVLEKDKNHTVENTSSYDLYMLIFENELDGKSTGMFIPKGAKVKVAIAKNDHVLFYAGNDMTKFLPARYQNQGYGNVDDAKRVSKDFNYHYCYQDENTFNLLNKVYYIQNLNPKETTQIINSNTLGLIINSDVIKKKM